MTLAAQLGAVVSSAGLALLLVAERRELRLAGLAAWAAGLAALALYLLPDLRPAELAAAAVGGAVVSALGAWALLRWPYLLAFATLACIPLRIPVDIGSEEVNLLLPLYAVVGALALSLAWQLLRGDARVRELGPAAWPLAAFVIWTGVTLAWSGDVRRGAIFVGAFVLPFGLLAIGFARLPWRGRWLAWLWGGLVASALAYAAVGFYQWATRDVFWNPSVIVFNAYAPIFRVNSVFWDPSVYGRYLAVAVLATLAGILLGGVRGWKVVGLYAVVAATWVGLLLSFSQSSFLALAAGIVVAAAVAWGRRAVLGLVVLGTLTVLVSVSVPQVREELVGKSRSSFDRVTSGRSDLVGQGVRIALRHPVQGVGVGGFGREYARRVGIRGDDPKRVASHTTPVTVAAEEGVLGLALFGWLMVAVLVSTLLRLGRGYTSRVSLAVGVALVAILVHSLFYNAFFEDPTTWALLGLVGLVSRVPKKAQPVPPAQSPAPADSAEPTMLAT
ncbi:MAG TPA: O-antigen ligase family protein [Gaiella sp.]